MTAEQKRFHLTIRHRELDDEGIKWTVTDYDIIDGKGQTVVHGDFRHDSHNTDYAVSWHSPVTADGFLTSVESTLQALETDETVRQAYPQASSEYIVFYQGEHVRAPIERPVSEESFRRSYPQLPKIGARFIQLETAYGVFTFEDRIDFKHSRISIISNIDAPDQLTQFVVSSAPQNIPPQPIIRGLFAQLGIGVRQESNNSSRVSHPITTSDGGEATTSTPPR